MAAPIGPGDWVECVDNRSRTCPGAESRLRLGAIYRVRRVGFAPVSGLPAVWLYEVDAYNPESGFWPDRFRPVYRPKDDFIESLKAPPIREPA